MSFFKNEISFCFKYIMIISILFANHDGLSAQSDTLAIKTTIDLLFEGMESFDSTKVKSVLSTDAFLKSIVKSKTGETKIIHETAQEFISLTGIKIENVRIDERLLSYEIKIDGDMAIAWTPYEFFINDIFSHCGVNVFTLCKLAGTWQIMGIVDTRRKTDCGK